MYEQFPPPQDLILKHPLMDPSFIFQSRKRFTDIFNQVDSRFVIILGPYSIDDPKAALEYARYVAELQKQVESQFFLIMRVYLEKPRTSLGWKGFLNDPNFNDQFDPLEGILKSRDLLNQINKLQVPIGTEFLSPFTAPYIQDLITWGSIGARTACSIVHRQLAAQCSMPIGFKNTVEGCSESAINGIVTATRSQKTFSIAPNGHISLIDVPGNPHCHLVLRGGTLTGPNFDRRSIERSLLSLEKFSQPRRLLVDCSHQNSGKNLENQIDVFKTIMGYKDGGLTSIFGAMLESYLVRGHQNRPLNYGQSLTDPCLGWEETRKLILDHSQCFV